MKLILGTKYAFDGENYIFEKLGNRKKITSRFFPTLLGKNKYQSVGGALLDRFGLLEKEEIHPFYSVRGEIAERLVLAYLKAQQPELVMRTWDKEEVNYDNFPNNPYYGGLIDIAIAEPYDARAVVEVKSKAMAKFKTIQEKGGSPEEEMQGEFLGYLSGVSEYIMVYVFFTLEQEMQITEHLSDDFFNGYEVNAQVAATKLFNHYGWQPHDFKFHLIPKHVRRDKVKLGMEITKRLMDDFENTLKIPQQLFKPDERIYLTEPYVKPDRSQQIDRPF